MNRKKPLKRTPIRLKAKTKEQKDIQRYERDKMNTFWFYCWANLPRYSEIDNKYRFRKPEAIHYHHLFEKGRNAFPELKYSLSNIVCVSSDEHACLNGDLNYFPIVKEKRDWVRTHWEQCVQESEEWSREYDRIKKEETWKNEST